MRTTKTTTMRGVTSTEPSSDWSCRLASLCSPFVEGFLCSKAILKASIHILRTQYPHNSITWQMFQGLKGNYKICHWTCFLVEDGAKGKGEEKVDRGREGKAGRRGRACWKKIEAVKNLSSICQRHVFISAWRHWNVLDRLHMKMAACGRTCAFLQLFVNCVKWSRSLSIVSFVKKSLTCGPQRVNSILILGDSKNPKIRSSFLSLDKIAY